MCRKDTLLVHNERNRADAGHKIIAKTAKVFKDALPVPLFEWSTTTEPVVVRTAPENLRKLKNPFRVILLINYRINTLQLLDLDCARILARNFTDTLNTNSGFVRSHRYPRNERGDSIQRQCTRLSSVVVGDLCNLLNS